jgi:hypothetical protein
MSLHVYSSPERRKKKLFRIPTFSKKNSVSGHYNYFSDDSPEPSFEDLPLGIHANHGWSYDFDVDGDSSDPEAELNDDVLMKPPSKYAQIHFHTNFDDDNDDHEIPQPCASELHQSAFLPRPPSPPTTSSYAPESYFPKSTQAPYPGQAYKADSDTSCTVDTDDEYDDPTYTLPKKRTIRFADEEGRELQTTYITERDKDDADEHLYHMRIIVLLLNPKKKQFEFLHLTTPRDDRTHLSEAIKLFPDLASDSSFTKQKYVGLCRPTKGGQELINSLCVQDYDLDRDEILVAIPSGMKGKTIVKISEPLVNDGNVKKMVRRKMRNGFAVQSLPHAIEMSREAYAEEKSETSTVLDESVQSSTCSERRDAQEKETGCSVEVDKTQESSSEEPASADETNREKDEAIASSDDNTEQMTTDSDTVAVNSCDKSASDEVEDSSQNVKECSDGTTEDETVLKINKESQESTSSIWAKASSIAKGFIQAHGIDKDEKVVSNSVESDKEQQSSSEEPASVDETNREKDEATASSDDNTEQMTTDSDIVTVKSPDEGTSDEVEDSSQKVNESNGTAEDETVSETKQNDEESTSSIWARATSIAKGFIRAHDIDKDEKDKEDELKQITEYIDELQRDVASEMESMNEFHGNDSASNNSTTDEAEGGDIGHLFKPVENTLDNALEDFNLTAGEANDNDGSREVGSIDASMDAFEHDKLVMAAGSTAAVSFTIDKDKSDMADSPALVVIYPSEDVASGASEDEKVMAVGGTEEPREAGRDDEMTNDIPVTKHDSVCEVESNDGSASFVVSSIDSEEESEGDGGQEENHSRDDSSSDGDEDDSDGAFPVMEPFEKVADKDEVEDVPGIDEVEDAMEDIPEIQEEQDCVREIGECSSSKGNEDADSLHMTNSVIEALEKRGLSLVQAHTKHIASGSFRSLNKEVDEKSDVPDMDSVLVELDEPKDVPSDPEVQKRRRFILFQVFVVTLGFLLRGFRKKKTAAKF